MTVTNLNDELPRLIGNAIEEHARGEDLHWAYGFVATPEQGALMFVSVWAKGLALGQHLNFHFMVNPMMLATNHDQIGTVVAEALGDMFEARSQQAAEMLADAEAHQAQMNALRNGNGS
jgi:hypothetical protein